MGARTESEEEKKKETERLDRITTAPVVTMGIHSKEGAFRPGEGSNASLVQIGSFHEFGTVDIPERPFLSRAFDINISTYRPLLARMLLRFIDGEIGLLEGLEIVGTLAASDIQTSITNAKNWAEPLEVATEVAKGSTSPLIDTGRMRQSIRHVVHPRGEPVRSGDE